MIYPYSVLKNKMASINNEKMGKLTENILQHSNFRDSINAILSPTQSECQGNNKVWSQQTVSSTNR